MHVEVCRLNPFAGLSVDKAFMYYLFIQIHSTKYSELYFKGCARGGHTMGPASCRPAQMLLPLLLLGGGLAVELSYTNRARDALNQAGQLALRRAQPQFSTLHLARRRTQQ